MYKLFGALNLALIAIAVAPYAVRKINQWFIHSKGKGFAKLMKVLRPLHKAAGLALLVSMFIHGWLALGRLQLHTGTVTAVMFGIVVIFGALFYFLRKAGLLKWHKALALAAILLAAVHLLFPSLLNGL